MRKSTDCLIMVFGIGLSLCMSAGHAHSWVPLGDDCSRLSGKFANYPTPYSPMSFAIASTFKPVRYIEISYVPEHKILRVAMYGDDSALMEKREWLEQVCEEGARVRSVIIGLTSGEAGAYSTEDITTDIGLDSEGNLYKLENIHLVRSTFGLFKRPTDIVRSFTYKRIGQ